MNFWTASHPLRRSDCAAVRCAIRWMLATVAALPASVGGASAAEGGVIFVDGREPESALTPPAEPALREKLAGVSSVEAVVDTVLAHYHWNGRPVTEVEVVPAAGEAGPLTVKISEGVIGGVAVEADSPWMAAAVLAQTRDLQGQPLLLGTVAGRLDWLHRHPLHAVTLGFRPGDGPATADAVFTVHGTRPWRLFAGWNNDGVDPLPEHRFSAGFELADPFGIPLWLTGEGSVSEDPEAFQSWRGAARWFLPWRHEWRLSGGWATARSDVLPAPLTGSELHDWNISSRYAIPIGTVAGAGLEVAVGADFRRTDSTVFAGGAAAAAAADTAQAALDLSLERPGNPFSWGEQVSLLWSPGGLTDGDADERHSALRPGAEAEHVVLRGRGWGRWDGGGGWAVSMQAGWQWTSAPVLPGGQIPVGGAAAVRGYPEASALGDDGVWGNLELEAPRRPCWCGVSGEAAPTWQPVVFLDAGWSADRVRDDESTLASAGVGVRVRWSRHAALAMDYAWRLTEPGGRLHLAFRFEF